jgi:hypothetical protein
MAIKEYMDDYYKLKTNGKEIQEKMGISSRKFYKLMKENDLKTIRKIYPKLDLGIEELNTGLKNRYSDIVKRCNNYESYQYKNGKYKEMYYLSLKDWVDLCLENKDEILKMWDEFIDKGKDPRLTLSVDRVNDGKGYFKNNIQFIISGVNTLKRNANPIKVTFLNKNYYFMSCQEASRYFNLREKTLGDLLRGVKRKEGDKYLVETTDIKTVLSENNINDISEYYNKVYIEEIKIQKGGKKC